MKEELLLKIGYSAKAVKLYMNQVNVGIIDNPDVTVTCTGLPCGDSITLYLKINRNTSVIEDAKFQYKGCVGIASSGSALTTLIIGKTVKEVLEEKFGSSNFPSWIETELIKPLRLNKLMERSTETLSGGELQALAVASSLISNSNFYFIDEPCSFLDVEQRVTVQRMIRRLTEIKAATTFVVEHDILFIDFVSDRLIVIDGTPGVHGRVSSPKSMKDGMNEFLSKLSITFRRDIDTNRPRINKPGSRNDLEQKQLGQYYYT